MKLNKKTIYKVDTKEKFNAMMKDAKEQGYYWCTKGDADTHPDFWDVYTDDTYVRITNDGYMMYGTLYSYGDGFTDHAHEDYVLPTTIYPLNFGGFCVDAPDFKTAYDEFQKHMLNIFGNKSAEVIPVRDADVYTIRVNDKNTTVITPDGKIATAKCHPDDEFDIIEGFKTAIEKIREMDRKLTFEEKKILSALELLNCSTFEITDYDQINGYNDNGNDVEIDITDKDVFSWLNTYKEFNVKEILEKYA